MSSKNYYVNGNTVRELDTPVRHNLHTHPLPNALLYFQQFL